MFNNTMLFWFLNSLLGIAGSTQAKTFADLKLQLKRKAHTRFTSLIDQTQLVPERISLFLLLVQIPTNLTMLDSQTLVLLPQHAKVKRNLNNVTEARFKIYIFLMCLF